MYKQYNNYYNIILYVIYGAVGLCDLVPILCVRH